jgi:hypothetical protein
MTPKGRCILNTVQELIDPVTGGWDEQLVRDNPVDVERIIHIHLPSFGQPEFIAWHLTTLGHFTVKSAYYAEWKAEYRRRARLDEVAGAAEPHQVWERI